MKKQPANGTESTGRLFAVSFDAGLKAEKTVQRWSGLLRKEKQNPPFFLDKTFFL
ncbi:hypothetical protein [Otoolea muris]|jgi:hypothetical protein|uniref:hypothetical protein n=1 Tax=Otoolea muris TaxID=2941515 RepID=UPI00203F150C|nr:hypothetical protein [Otoolea muris]